MREDTRCMQCVLVATNTQLFILMMFVIFGSVGVGVTVFNHLKIGQAILFVYMQTLGIISTLALDWPAITLDLFSVFQITNGDVRIDCIFPGMDYSGKWKTYMMAPFFALGGGIVLLFCVYLPYAKFYRKENITLKDLLHIYISRCVAFIAFIYLPLTAKALEIFRCIEIDGFTVSLAEPSLVCGEDWWQDLRVVAVFYIVLYGFDIPMVLCYYFFHTRPMDSVTFDFHGLRLPKHVLTYAPVHEGEEQKTEAYVQWEQTVNSITFNFSRDGYFWTLMVMMRNLTIVCVGTLLSTEPVTQAFFVLVCIGIAAVLHVRKQPYRNKRLNQMETISLVSSWWLLFTGILFTAQNNLAPLDGMYTPLLVTFFIMSFVFCAGVCVAHVHRVPVQLWGDAGRQTHEPLLQTTQRR